MSSPPDPSAVSQPDLSQNTGHASGEQPLPPPLPAAGRGVAPDQPLPPPLSGAERGVAPDAAVSVGNADSHGGGIAIGPNATVNDQRRYEYHLPAAAPSGPAFVVPYPHNPLFTGRDAELARLTEWLDGGAAVAVVGTGGLGKTQLAAEYALGARARYPGGVFWLNMEQPEGIAGQVADLAGPRGLNLPAAPALDFQGKRDAVRAAWEEPVARLLIFDNLEDPAVWREWRPRGGGARVLITSRRQTWAATSGVETLPLQPLGRRAGQELLLAPRAKGMKTTPAALLADPARAADADAICEALGDLPLALALAGAYLETTPSATLARYRADIEAAPLARLETTLDEPLPTGHEASILKTFALSYDKLDANRPDDALARTILHRAAFLAPAPIPRRMLVRAAELDPADAYAQEQVDHALRRLAALGLVEDLGDEGVRLHRLVAAYARHRAAAPAEDSAAVEQALIDEVYVINKAGYPRSGLPYLSHLQWIAAMAEQRIDEQASTLLSQLGYLLWTQGDIVGARLSCERELKITERLLQPDHSRMALSLNNLGYVLKEQGDLIAARSLFERAIQICETTLGPTHPHTAMSVNNLGLVLIDLGNLAGARTLLKRSLAIREQILGPIHESTGLCLINLGALLKMQGNVAGARALFERALGIFEQVLGPTHYYTALGLTSLGRLLYDSGDPTSARPYLERALAIREQVLGPLHPQTAKSLIYMGELLEDLRDLAKARSYFERALAIQEQALGPSHPETANLLNTLGGVLRAQGDLAGAQRHLERALAIYEQVFGLTHLDTASILNNLGALLYEQGNPAGALLLLQRALTIRKQKLRPDHPHTRITRTWLKAVRRAMKNGGEQSIVLR